MQINVLDHGFVKLLNIASPAHRTGDGGYPIFGADDTDPAKVARISFDNLEKERLKEQDLRLYEYLIANNHNTPIEMIETWWHMQMPIFVARHVVRHRTASINEVSARYAVLPETWYIPEPENVGVKSVSNKQGRDLNRISDLEMAGRFCTELNEICRDSYRQYKYWLNNGIAPELARCFLHVNHYTHWVFKIDLHNLMHFLSLRCDVHAQWEAQQYGNAMYNILKQYLPKSMELFDTYRRKATPEELERLHNVLEFLSDDNCEQETLATVQKFFKRIGVK